MYEVSNARYEVKNKLLFLAILSRELLFVVKGFVLLQKPETQGNKPLEGC